MTRINTNKFSDRLKFVLRNRKIHVWGAALGLGKTVRTRLNQGILPGADKLIPVIKAENLSATWLIEGKGQPYLVNTCLCDTDAAALLDELYAEAWTTTLLTDGDRIAIVLTQPGEYQIEKTSYPYTIIEVLVGHLGSEALQCAAQHATCDNTRFVETTPAVMAALSQRQIGTHQLTTEVINTATAYHQQTQPRPLQGAEEKTGYLTSGISTDEMDILSALRHIDPQNREHITAVIKALTGGSTK
jgi:hypothetical protein